MLSVFLLHNTKDTSTSMTPHQNPANDIPMPWLDHYPEGITWDDDIPAYAVSDMLDKTCEEFGSKPAFDFMGRRWRWADIGRLSDRLARGLQEAGVTKGMRIGLCLPNCPYFLIAYYAILKTSAIVVNFNPLYPARELKHLIEDSETEMMVTTDLTAIYPKIEDMLHDTRLNKIIVCRFIDILPFPKDVLFWFLKNRDLAKVKKDERILWFHRMTENDGQYAPATIEPAEDIAVLQYTGGTTGVPKGAMLTHANITANTEQAVRWLAGARAGEEKMLGVLPFFHVFAMTAVMNLSVRLGFEIIALPRFDLEKTLKLIHRKKPHYFPAVPAIYNAINNHRKKDSYRLDSLRYCISGGAPLPIEVKMAFEKQTGCVVVEGYGLSETSPILTVNPVNGENKPGSIGLPLPGTLISLVSAEDGTSPVKQGERGEIRVKGPQVMKGYWNSPEATAETIRNGWLHTGDIATMDEEGYFYIVDRIKDLIITNGYNVYPRNVEEAIYLHPNVEECIVAGRPDKARGEIVKAWIKPKEGRDLTPEDIKDFLKDKLSRIEMPRQIEIRQTPLPKTMIGKLSRKDILAEEMEKTENRPDRSGA